MCTAPRCLHERSPRPSSPPACRTSSLVYRCLVPEPSPLASLSPRAHLDSIIRFFPRIIAIRKDGEYGPLFQAADEWATGRPASVSLRRVSARRRTPCTDGQRVMTRTIVMNIRATLALRRSLIRFTPSSGRYEVRKKTAARRHAARLARAVSLGAY